MEKQTAFITGGTTGIGREIAITGKDPWPSSSKDLCIKVTKAPKIQIENKPCNGTQS